MYILFYVYIKYIYIYSYILSFYLALSFWWSVLAQPDPGLAMGSGPCVPRLHRSAAAASGSWERPEMPRRPMTHVKNMTSEYIRGI